MDVLLLRLIHIGFGAFWVGSVFTFLLFVQPAAMAVGPEATKFTYQLLHHRRFSLAILVTAATTVLAGIWLLVITSNGLNPEFLFSESRLGYTVGGVAAILTFGIGALYIFPRTQTVERTIGLLIAEARPPAPDEQQTLARVGRENLRAGWVVLFGLAVAIVSMATAKLWGLFV